MSLKTYHRYSSQLLTTFTALPLVGMKFEAFRYTPQIHTLFLSAFPCEKEERRKNTDGTDGHTDRNICAAYVVLSVFFYFQGFFLGSCSKTFFCSGIWLFS